MRLRALAGQAAEDAALGHLKAGCDGGYSGQRGWQAGHICLHVAQQLLQLVQNWGPGHRERRARERWRERWSQKKGQSDGQVQSEREDTGIKGPQAKDKMAEGRQEKSDSEESSRPDTTQNRWKQRKRKSMQKR